MIDRYNLMCELDDWQSRLPGYSNRLNFFLDADTGEWVAIHQGCREIWHTKRDTMFVRRHRNPDMLLMLFRAYLRGLVEPVREAAE